MLRDERRLGRKLAEARRLQDSAQREAAIVRVAQAIERAEQQVERRKTALPPIAYPELPVTDVRDEIAAAIRDHQVVVIAGETGSGKTTQLPKICAELGRGVRGLIGHTQPRRIAARAVSERIAEELDIQLGGVVGYAVRFADKTSDQTMIKVMTDGVLLAEAHNDPNLYAYDTIIIDEAHERSLNIDFLLGYLKRLLPRRPDLKIIITSATIDPDKFAKHFDNAPVIEVSGRTYPVEVRYRPLVDLAAGVERDQPQGICDAVVELCAQGPGDVLVFCSGEREIRDAADALAGLKLPNTEILPLFARLSAADQHRVFHEHVGRRIVLATNVAETSLTVPGIHYVVDAGTARISRFSSRTKVQRLPIEPISQASAHQRAGRCGRVADGICIRLYSEEDYESRPAFTEPEILRTNLASVVLRMAALRIGDTAEFPFLDMPDRRSIAAAMQLLTELQAVDGQPQGAVRLSAIGRDIARFPIDPRFARMLVQAHRDGCLREVLIIVAGMSIQDPRERPAEQQGAADTSHARFTDPHSDFMAYFKLWTYLRERQRELSSGQFRRMCKAEFLHYLRIREWQDLYSQLEQIATELGYGVNKEPAPAQRVHMSIVAGLLSHVGFRDGDKNDYLSARGSRFSIFPGSALAKRPPRWAMAAELVDTSRLWGRIVARIEPEWIEPLAGHLVKRSYSEPRWHAKQGAVVGYERVTLYGITLTARRQVNYGHIDPELSRELFIRHALIEGEWKTHHAFFRANEQARADAAELEERTRQRGLVIDDEALYAFYDERIPADVVSARHFDSWWKKARATDPNLLTLDPSDARSERAAQVEEADYPLVWSTSTGLDLPQSYVFEPGSDVDGVQVDVPLAALPQLSGHGLAWQVPGLRREIVTALLRSLPKELRRNFVPIPDYVATVLEHLPDDPAALLHALSGELRARTGVVVPDDAWTLENVPAHLRTTFRVVDDVEAPVAVSKDLNELKARLKAKTRAAVATGSTVERVGLRDWDFDELPRAIESDKRGFTVTGYPALVAEGDTVAVRVLATEDEQRQAMWSGTRQLLRLTITSPARSLIRSMDTANKLALRRNPYQGVEDLLDDCVNCATDALMRQAGGPVWTHAKFRELRDQVRADLSDAVEAVAAQVRPLLEAASAVEDQLTRPAIPAAARNDMRQQLARLYYPGFISATGADQLPDVGRYLAAIVRRIEKLPSNPAKDHTLMLEVQQVQHEYDELHRAVPPQSRAASQLMEVRWMIEELRVSYFAQNLGVPYAVSQKRIFAALDAITW